MSPRHAPPRVGQAHIMFHVLPSPQQSDEALEWRALATSVTLCYNACLGILWVDPDDNDLVVGETCSVER